jgi:hypothetical protein
MLVSSLEQMEQIVDNNKALSWDGWDVVQLTPSNSAWMQTNGAYISGKWYTRKRYAVSTNGWEIPNKFVR